MSLGIDPELLRQLMDFFAIELEEQLQTATESLLLLEKDLPEQERQKLLNNIFRAFHNIKGAGRGVGVLDVADIAHELESIFTVLKRENKKLSPGLADLVLESLDAMRQAMLAHTSQQALGFDKQKLIARLEAAAKNIGKPGTEPEVEQQGIKPIPLSTAEPVLNKEDETQASASTEQKPSPTTQDAQTAEMVRIHLEKLDALGALMEELQITKIQMDEHLAHAQKLKYLAQDLKNDALAKTNSSGAIDDFIAKRSTRTIIELEQTSTQLHMQMRSSIKRLSTLMTALQENVHMMRLTPAASLLRPLSRQVRDLARELNKKVHYKIAGDDIEIDRMVLDQLHDPLIHLIRNALDHGIEHPAQRQNRGKPAEGELLIAVSSKGSQIEMIVQDDGNGIYVDQIAAIALEKKIVSEAELAGMGRDEILSLLFRSDFSSKDIITTISGRGVGLDVVLENLQRLKGSVQIETQEGLGTRFILNLPLTLATEQAVLVRTGGIVAAIPTSAIVRVMEIRPEHIIEVEASHALLHQGRTIALRDLALILELKPEQHSRSQALSIVIIAKGWYQIAFLVDEIIGERALVIKPLRPPLIHVPNIIGGTLTAGGDVIMVLNPGDLVDSAMSSSLNHWPPDSIKPEAIPKTKVLVVDDSITSRTLEKNILEQAGYEVSLAVDGKQALNILQRNNSFDLVISDVEMPAMNGFELTEQIKQSPTLKHLPVIIVSSLNNEADQLRGIQVGADAYIIKGQFETRTLLDVVEQLV